MTKEQLSTERIIMVALMKAFSEQSTFMIGEFKMELKQSLNNLIKRTDEFVYGIEQHLTENQKEYLQSITDIYHNMNLEIRSNLNKKYEELKSQNK